jgi:hypothetical protein
LIRSSSYQQYRPAGGERLNLSFYVHDEAVTASSPPGDTARRYMYVPYESADLYGPTKN